MRARRAPTPPAARPAGAFAYPAGEAPTTGIYAVTRAEVEQAGQLNTVIGQQALLIARRLDQDRDTGAGSVALNKELRATMSAVTLNAPAAPGLLDDLERRRQRKIAATHLPEPELDGQA